MKKNLFIKLSLLLLLVVWNTHAWAKTFYLLPNSDWKGSSAKFAICYGYDGSDDQTFVEMTQVTGTSWYSAEVPSGASSKNVYFMRVSSGWKTSDKWTNKWNGFGWYSYSNGDRYKNTNWDAGEKVNVGFESSENGIKYYKNSDANDTEWKFNGQSAQTTDLSTVSNLYLKEWFTYEYEGNDIWTAKDDGNHSDWTGIGATVMKYNVHRTAASAGAYTSLDKNWTSNADWDGGYKKSKAGNNYLNSGSGYNLRSGLGSGKYTMSFYYYDPVLNITSPTHSLKWTIGVPAVSDGAVTSNGTGTGEEGSPFSVADGNTITFTALGSQASTDANSVLYVKWGGDSYAPASSTTKTITPTTTKQSMTVKLKYYNSADELSGAETTLTIYYQSTLTPSIGISSISPSPANSGDEVTITASRQNAGEANITYQYSLNGESGWTTIGSATSSTTKTWTVPAITTTTTYYFRAQMTYSATTYTSDVVSLKAYGKKTIKVKNTNGWSPFYMHRWGGDRADTSFPGDDDQISAYGSGQWKQVVLYSSNDNFIFVDGTNTNNKNSDQTYASMTDGSCYEIASGIGSLALNSTANCPAKPGVSVSAATSVLNTSATLNGGVSSYGNDALTEYGFYWSADDNDDTAAEIKSNGTKVQKGTTGDFTGSLTHNLADLTAGTTIHFITYAINGQGETLSSVQSFVVPYKVTISKSTGCSSISPSGVQYTTSSINLTADAATGYTFNSWSKTKGDLSSAASPSAGRNTVTFTPNADNATITATYDEDMHDVTVNTDGSGGGSITSPAGVSKTVSAGIASASTTITATPANAAWLFKEWTIPSGVTIASGSTTTPSITINATADSKTITANFKPRFGLNGSLVGDDSPGHGMPGWVFGNAADFEVKSFTGLGDDGVCLQCTCTLDPNTTYKFRVLDREINNRRGCNAAAEPANVLPAGSNWELNYTEGKGAQDVRIKTVGRGTYIFHITNLSDDGNEYPSIQVERQASHLVSLGQGYVDIDGGTHSSSTTGGTISAEATESGITVGITNGQYIANGGKLEWAPDPATGYTLSHYYGASDFSGDSFDFTTINPVSEAANVYAKFVETSTAVTIEHNEHGHVTVGGVTATSTTVGITTTRALVAVPDAGYYFAGWTIEGSDIELQDKSDDEDATVTLHGRGAGTAAILTANFVELDKIYFRNIDQSTGEKLWDNDHIYVYFGTTWKNDKGVQTLSNYAEMSPAFDTKIYWAYVPHAFTKSSNTHVAFSDVDMHNNSEFYNNHGVYRTDYNKALNMFVPNRTTSGTTNGTVYHSNGYWKVYDPKVGAGQGYYLQLHTGDDGEGHGTYTEKGQFTAVADGSSKISYTMRVDNTSTQTQYRIASAGGVHYIANATITTAARENVTVNEYKNCDNCYFTVTLTSEGDYTFILDQSEDYMKLTVDYPVSVGDYRLKHTYNDRSDKTTYSDVIKANDASTSRTLSMYLSTEGSETLVLQKCTAIVAGVPAWDAGDGTNLGGILTTVGSNPGVYQFDVSVSGDQVAEAPTATKYTGPYYIKTDGANGGWVNYKQNFMDENTLNYDTNHPEKSFNYYYCKYFSSAGANLKCVIANDYCNALTDTLIGDAVIGIDKQATPSAVSVRFSYNSYTNEVNRAYLGASLASDFLRILGNTTASTPHIYSKDEASPGDATAKAYIKFEDKQNWRYEIDVKADVNARAKLTATFNSQTQYFMGAEGETGQEWDNENTVELFGGESGTYGLTLVYDFKTNKLIRAWKPIGGSTISENLTLKSDVLLLREHQGAPAAITFGKIGETDVYASLTEVKTVYSVLRFNRWRLGNRANPTDVNSEHCKTTDSIAKYHPALSPGGAGYLSQYERELYFISFPYDVKMSDIIHFGGYYDTWGIMYYDGKGRAKNGYWIDSESNWKYFTPEEFATKDLKAYEGYLIGIDLAAMRFDNTSFWTNNSSEVDIYFPSETAISTITQKAVTVDIDTVGYKCTINRDFGGEDGDRRIKDSHWHCIGVPSYADLSHAINNGAPADADWTNKELLYLYRWNTSTNEHAIEKASDFSFQAMYAYLVQYAGTTLSWAAASATGPTSIAAKRMKTEELRDRQFNLQLLQGDKEADHTYIRLSDDEEVTSGFEFNHDVSKMMLSGANIYTLIGKEQAAANSLPLNLEETTVVPVGVKIAADGEYTFAIPEGTEGVGVVLIDNITGARTNLALTDYEVSLTAGKIEDRFSLEISPIQYIPTDIEETEVGNQNSAIRKVMVDGILYIVKDGKVFDAQGRQVK